MNPEWLNGLAGLDGGKSAFDDNGMKLFSLLSSFIFLQFTCIASIDDSISEYPLTATSSDEIGELYNSRLLVSFGFGRCAGSPSVSFPVLQGATKSINSMSSMAGLYSVITDGFFC